MDPVRALYTADFSKKSLDEVTEYLKSVEPEFPVLPREAKGRLLGKIVKHFAKNEKEINQESWDAFDIQFSQVANKFDRGDLAKTVHLIQTFSKMRFQHIAERFQPVLFVGASKSPVEKSGKDEKGSLDEEERATINKFILTKETAQSKGEVFSRMLSGSFQEAQTLTIDFSKYDAPLAFDAISSYLQLEGCEQHFSEKNIHQIMDFAIQYQQKGLQDRCFLYVEERREKSEPVSEEAIQQFTLFVDLGGELSYRAEHLLNSFEKDVNQENFAKYMEDAKKSIFAQKLVLAWLKKEYKACPDDNKVEFFKEKVVPYLREKEGRFLQPMLKQHFEDQISLVYKARLEDFDLHMQLPIDELSPHEMRFLSRVRTMHILPHLQSIQIQSSDVRYFKIMMVALLCHQGHDDVQAREISDEELTAMPKNIVFQIKPDTLEVAMRDKEKILTQYAQAWKELQPADKRFAHFDVQFVWFDDVKKKESSSSQRPLYSLGELIQRKLLNSILGTVLS